MFKDIQLGDDVWDVRYGWGKVLSISNHPITYPLTAQFTTTSKKPINVTYTMEGKAHKDHSFPILFWNEFKIPAEAFIKPLPKLEVDTKVLVWDDDNFTKCKRHFYEFSKNGLIRTYRNGTTSFSTDKVIETWPNWELYKEQQC